MFFMGGGDWPPGQEDAVPRTPCPRRLGSSFGERSGVTSEEPTTLPFSIDTTVFPDVPAENPVALTGIPVRAGGTSAGRPGVIKILKTRLRAAGNLLSVPADNYNFVPIYIVNTYKT